MLYIIDLYGYPWYLDLKMDIKRLKKKANIPSPSIHITISRIKIKSLEVEQYNLSLLLSS